MPCLENARFKNETLLLKNQYLQLLLRMGTSSQVGPMVCLALISQSWLASPFRVDSFFLSSTCLAPDESGWGNLGSIINSKVVLKEEQVSQAPRGLIKTVTVCTLQGYDPGGKVR